MTIAVSPQEAQLFEQHGYSYDDVSATIEHYRGRGLSDADIQSKINARVSEFKNGEVPTVNERALDSLQEVPQDSPYVQTQEFQKNELANMLFSKEELEEMKNKGPMGWVEYRGRNFVGWSDIMPVVGLGKQIYEPIKAVNIAKKLENGEEVSDSDKDYMVDYLRKYVEADTRGLSWSTHAARMFIQAPAFMVEFALTGGLGEAVAKAGIKTLTKSTSKVALQGVQKGLARAGGYTTTLVPAYAVANYGERTIADGLNVTDKGDKIFNSEAAEANSDSNKVKAALTGAIIVGSELTGGLLGYIAKKGGTYAAKSLGKVANTNIGRGISAVSASIYNSLPKSVRVKLEAAARLTDKLGDSVRGFNNKMKDQNIEFHGILEEMGEERVEDVLMTAFDLDAQEGYSADQFLRSIYPGYQQLLLEAGIFTVVGSASLATRTVASDLMNRGYSKKEATNIVNNLSETEKENLANDILGEVKINEDITEEEVEQEENAIQLKLFGGVEMNVAADELYDAKNIGSDSGKEIIESRAFRDFYNGKVQESTIGELLNHEAINDDIEEVKDVTVKQRFEYRGNTPIKHTHIYGGSTGIENGKIVVYTNTRDLTPEEVRDNLFHELHHARQWQEAINGDIEARQELKKISDLLLLGDSEGYKNSNYEKQAELSKQYLKNKLEVFNETNRKTNSGMGNSYELPNSNGRADKNAYERGDEPGRSISSSLERTAAASEKSVGGNKQDESLTDNSETFKDKIQKRISDWFDSVYTDWVDRFTPIEKLVKKAETAAGEKLSKEDNPYYLARMYAGLVESIKSQVNDKTFIKENGKIKITGEGFMPIIDDYIKTVKDIEPNYDKAIKDLSDYLIAKRYLLDLKDRDGFEATEQQKLKAVEDMTRLNIKYGDKIDDISKISDRIYAFKQRILHNLVDSGNMSQETFDKIIEENPHHISYKRVLDDNYGSSAFVTKGKFTDAKSPVKKIKGSEKDIQNIFVSTLEDVARILDTAERNKVAKAVANLRNILPEDIEKRKPLMQVGTAKVKVAYDAKMRAQLEEAIKYFGGNVSYQKAIKGGRGLILGSYNPEENIVRKRLGSQDRTLAHEFGHLLDYALGIEQKLTPEVKKEIAKLAKDRLESIVSLNNSEYYQEINDAANSKRYQEYVQSTKEAIANMFDLYFTSRDYVKKTAPKTYKFIEDLFKDKYKFLKDIRPSSETGIEEIEQETWVPSIQKPFGNVITYYDNGKRQFVEVSKPVMEAVEGLNSSEIDFINKFLTGSATLLRTGATITPEFALRNFIRDQETATIYIKNYNPIIDSVRGLANVIGKTETYKEWLKAGGAFGSYMELNEKSINKALKEFVGEKSRLQQIADKINILKPFEKFSSLLEQATRLSIYTRSKLNGADAMQAAFDAREGTLDFARSGKEGRKWNRKIPFFNAGIQGTDKIIRAFRENLPLATIKAIATITIPQIVLTSYYLKYAPDDDKKEYLEIPQWQKDFFYCFKVGDNWLRIPKDFTLGYVFGSLPERFMVWAEQNKKPEGKELAQMALSLFGSASPINNPTDILPPILRIIIENITNYDFFRGKHIYPEHLNDLEPAQRTEKYTSETAKFLGEKLGISPAKIDHAISGQFGTSGKYMTDAGDLMINSVREFNGEEAPGKATELADLPIIRGFLIRDPVGYQAISTNKFFDNYKEASQANATYNKLKKSGDSEKAREYKEKNKQKINAYKHLSDVKKDINAIGKQMDKIYANKNLTNEEKINRIKPLAKRLSDKAFDADVWYGERIKE